MKKIKIGFFLKKKMIRVFSKKKEKLRVSLAVRKERKIESRDLLG